MRKQCAVCLAEFEAKRAAARYCSERCRKRAQRQPNDRFAKMPAQAVPDALHGLRDAVQAELATAGRLDSSGGQAALILAERIGAGGESGTALAALVKQLHVTLAEVAKDARPAGDPVEDELRAARDRKRALTGS